MLNLIAHLVRGLLQLHGWPVYLVVAALTFVESAAFVGFILPGETAMVVAGILAARGNISLAVILAVAAVSAVSGDQVGYLIGRHLGTRLREGLLSRRIGDHRWDRAEAAVRRHGGWSVLGARWVAVLRALVPTVAGALRMPYRTFLAANAIGGVSWSVVAVMIGYWGGGSVSSAQDLLSRTSILGVTILGVAAMTVLSKRHRHRRRLREGGQPALPPITDPSEHPAVSKTRATL